MWLRGTPLQWRSRKLSMRCLSDSASTTAETAADDEILLKSFIFFTISLCPRCGTAARPWSGPFGFHMNAEEPYDRTQPFASGPAPGRRQGMDRAGISGATEGTRTQ